MSLVHRRALYKKLQDLRDRPLIAYVTSPRQGVDGRIANDVVHEFLIQLEALPANEEKLDLLLISNGGDATVAWRIVSLIRERVKEFSVLVPGGAFSAATLIALGADKIVMHANGSLGPVDPQLHVPRPSKGGEQSTSINFGSEDLAAFLAFAREEVGLTDQEHLLKVFGRFCDDVGSVPIGIAARSARLSLTMAEKLLRMHMKDGGQRQQAKTIAEKLSREFYHHGYALGRSEAESIGLPVQKPNDRESKLLWDIWLDFVEELDLRRPFDPLNIVYESSEAKALLSPVPSINLPPNSPPQLIKDVFQKLLQHAVVHTKPIPYKLVAACLESQSVASHFAIDGQILVARQPDLKIELRVIPYRSGWRNVSENGDEKDTE